MRPTSDRDYICRYTQPTPASPVRRRRQATECIETGEVPSVLTCDNTASTSACLRRVEAAQRARTAARTNVDEVPLNVVGPSRSCDNTSFLLGDVCVPCSECGMGSKLARECTATADTVCNACPKGTYRPERWHMYRFCLIANGCPGGNRFKKRGSAGERATTYIRYGRSRYRSMGSASAGTNAS